MKIRVPSYFKDFKCIASACEDTCCAGWGIVIDEETHKCYQTIDTAFGETLRSKIVEDEDGDNVFILNGEDCPFLNKKNLCDIYTELGEKYLCYTCRQFPRYMEEFVDLREMGISLSCPEAARTILGNNQITTFELSEDDQPGEEDDRIDDNVLEDFLLCRNVMIDILEMDTLSLEVRAAIILKFIEEVQDKVDFEELDELKDVIEKYSESHFITELIDELYECKGNEIIKYNNVHEYFKTYKDLEHIHANDPLGLDKVIEKFFQSEMDSTLYTDQHGAFNAYYQDNMYKFKNIIVYFLFRYFMKSIFDYELSAKVKLAIVSAMMIKELAVVRWMDKGQFTEVDMVDISHMYSKDIEHLEANIEALQQIFESQEAYAIDNVVMTVMNEF